ncbi:MAG: caspase family protein [Saprospiraceae bacterium]
MKKLMSLVVLSLLIALQTASAQCIRGNCKNGKGTYKYTSGAKYVGQFKNGRINGNGILYFSNGNKYVGDWVNQYREGKGKLTYANGSYYKGSFKRSKFHGKGSMKSANGDRYEGDWKSDLQDGEGKYYYSNGDRYEGSFKKGKLNGKGKMFYNDGSKFVGTWLRNYKNGPGTFYKTNGKAVTGNWENGQLQHDQSPEKEEVLIAQNTTENETNSNASTVSSSSTKESLKDCNSIFCKTGKGQYIYGDGSRYVGLFKEGKPEGEGTCFYSNGDKYVGGWKRHAPHGEGIMYYQNGRVVGAKWSYGKPTKRLDASQSVSEEYVEVDRNSEVKIWAVVVGVARYAHMPALKYTDDDAYHIYAFLKSPEGGALPDDQIKVLIDEDATRNNIIRTMRQVLLKADENDVVIMYFSGHGLPGAFLPIDFDGFNNKLDHDDIKKILDQSKAKHKLCLADACHSGSLMAMRSTVDNTIKKYYDAFNQSSGGTALLLSSKGDEYSLEDGGLRQGIFSHYLIRGLKGEADKDKNKIVTITELYDFVYRKVRHYTGNVQTPTLTGSYDNGMPVSVVR